MKKTVITLLAAAFMTAGVFAEKGERPQRAGVMKEAATAHKHLQSDPEIQKLRERMQTAFVKRLTELGISEEVAKRSVQMRAKRAASVPDRWGGRERRPGGERQGRSEIRAPKNPLTPGWSEKAERKLKRKGKRDE